MVGHPGFPVDLARLVLSRLPPLVDRVRFATVCQQWRATARETPPPSPPLPLLLLPDGTAYSFPCHKPLRFPACAGYAGSCCNWLLYSGNGVCFLWNPLTNAMVSLPALSRFCALYTSDDLTTTATVNPLTVTRFILCSPHLIAAVVRLGCSSRIEVCKPGADSLWSICMDDQTTFLLISDMFSTRVSSLQFITAAMIFSPLTSVWANGQGIHGFLESTVLSKLLG